MTASVSRVDRGGRLVEEQDRGILEKGAGDRDPLAFAAGELGPALADHRLVLLGQAHDEIVSVRRFGGGDDLVHVASSRPYRMLFGDGVGEQQRLLLDQADFCRSDSSVTLRMSTPSS